MSIVTYQHRRVYGSLFCIMGYAQNSWDDFKMKPKKTAVGFRSAILETEIKPPKQKEVKNEKTEKKKGKDNDPLSTDLFLFW